MVKLVALLVVAIVGAAVSTPLGGIGGVGVAKTHTHHVRSSVISPYLGMGLGYGMMGIGYPGIGIGHTVSSHSVARVPHLGFGLKGLGVGGMYPGGIGIGHGMIG